ncbi:MAG: hypothetical protein AUJ57_00615 [Zetaproteobacteria bacterium CG1_02_53_45]|nr:MAG: hypothetical protein AUJ57_00615 [Zetaproteobacteria bacterium CG1_02_53_45]
MKLFPLLFLLLPGFASPSLCAEQVDVARFSQHDMHGWKAREFKGETRYTLVKESGRFVLQADSNNNASGLYREVNIDLARTPFLNWSWKVGNVLKGIDERTRDGDDYPARVYVVFSQGLLFWRTRAINYVWSSNQPVGSNWLNAFTDNARMIAVESSPGKIGEWINERRDVRKDYRQLFGEEPDSADAIAIMTDTDNSGLSAIAWYGDIWFSAE